MDFFRMKKKLYPFRLVYSTDNSEDLFTVEEQDDLLYALEHTTEFFTEKEAKDEQ